MKILILEDDFHRVAKFTQNFIGCELDITKDPHEANKWIASKEYDLIFLDHDLEDAHYLEDCMSKETTGLCTADFLGQHPHLNPDAQIIIHSLNPAGVRRMKQACRARGPRAIPFINMFK